MTKQEYKNVVRVHGKHFKNSDIPAFWRRDREAEMLATQAEDLEQERLCQYRDDDVMAEASYEEEQAEEERQERLLRREERRLGSI